MKLSPALAAAILLAACKDEPPSASAAPSSTTPAAKPDASSAAAEVNRQYWRKKRDAWRAAYEEQKRLLRSKTIDQPPDAPWDNERSLALIEMRNMARNEDIHARYYEMLIEKAAPIPEEDSAPER